MFGQKTRRIKSLEAQVRMLEDIIINQTAKINVLQSQVQVRNRLGQYTFKK